MDDFQNLCNLSTASLCTDTAYGIGYVNCYQHMVFCEWGWCDSIHRTNICHGGNPLDIEFPQFWSFSVPFEKKNQIKIISIISHINTWSLLPRQSAEKLKWYQSRDTLCLLRLDWFSLSSLCLFGSSLIALFHCIVHFISLRFNYNRIS